MQYSTVQYCKDATKPLSKRTVTVVGVTAIEVMNRAKKSQRFLNLTNAEASAVQSMFKLYDINASGYIRAHLALKLIRSLGKR